MAVPIFPCENAASKKAPGQACDAHGWGHSCPIRSAEPLLRLLFSVLEDLLKRGVNLGLTFLECFHRFGKRGTFKSLA